MRANHHFVSEEDIIAFRRLVRHGLAYYHDLCAVRGADGQVVGFVVLDGEKIGMLFVHPNYHAKGMGKRLVQSAIDGLEAPKVDVSEQNTQALGFFLHLGFAVAGHSEHDGTGRPYTVLHLELLQLNTACA